MGPLSVRVPIKKLWGSAGTRKNRPFPEADGKPLRLCDKINGMRIMLVDDSLAMRLVYRKFLAARGLEDIIEAASGEQALEISARGGIDLIIMDVKMPGLTGIEVLQKLKSDPGRQAIPVIMATSETLKSTILSAIKAGADGYVFKPIKRDDLLEALAPYLK
jgi:CheY-like chemotaxis protein